MLRKDRVALRAPQQPDQQLVIAARLCERGQLVLRPVEVGLRVLSGAGGKFRGKAHAHGVDLLDRAAEVFRHILLKLRVRAEEPRQICLQQILILGRQRSDVHLVQIVQIPVLRRIQPLEAQVDQQEKDIRLAHVHSDALSHRAQGGFLFIVCPEHHGCDGICQPIVRVLQVDLFDLFSQCLVGDDRVIQPDHVTQRDAPQLVEIRKARVILFRALCEVF